MTDDIRWYCVLTAANREADATYRLKRQGYDVFFPRRWHTWSRNGHTTSELRPFLSRYIFVAVGAGQSVYAINETQDVSRVLTYSGEAYIVSSDEIWRVRKLFDPDGVEPPGTRSAKHIRKMLRGIKGEMAADLMAALERIDDRGRYRLQRNRAVRLAAVSLPVLHRKTAERDDFSRGALHFT